MSEGELIAGRYELLELVGRGGMSSVWCAHDRLLDRTVAIKVLHEQYTDDEEYLERFRREARSVAQLSHPNIVTVIDRGEDGGRQFIVFEYVDGENLKQVIERTGRLPVRDALVTAIQMGRALAFAHERGLVHRDVKPQNVLLNEDGEAKMTDFGIARSVDVAGVTTTGTVLGTSEYIAPEQARGEHVDALTDVYSLGVVLYELLTGSVPFQGESFVAIALRHVNEPAPNLLERRPDAPPRVALAAERAMAKNPADRFQSMGEFVAELETALAELDPASEQATMIARPPAAAVPRRREDRPRRRRGGVLWPIAAVLAVLAVAAVAALGALALRNDGSPGAANAPISVRGIGAYDPEGGDGEHDDEAGLATDGQASTFWRTSTYQSNLSALKNGVGLVLDAQREVEPKTITVTSTTPGFEAEIQAGNSPDGGFTRVSDSKTVESRTTFELDGAAARYFVVWITEIPAGTRAEITEVTVR